MKVITIGRSKEHNDIVVNDERVSRNHLQMIMEDNGNYFVQDLNSTNGTFVNGRRITGQVPLNVNDELKIGNTVLSWQCYFSSQPNTGAPTSHQTSTPQSPVPLRNPIQDPAPKRWLIYVIIGAVVLLLAGGGIGWKMYHDKQQKTELEEEIKKKEADSRRQKDLSDAKVAADQAEKEYAEAMRKAAEAQMEAERKERIAAQSKSEKDKKAAESAKVEAEQKKKEAAEAKKAQDEANKKVSQLQNKVRELTDKLNEEQEKVKVEKENAAKTQNLTLSMQKILNGWNNNEAAEFCKNQKWSCKSKNDAKNVITEKFSQLDNAQKQKVIDVMKKHSNSDSEKQ